jgi:hypothetical protein
MKGRRPPFERVMASWLRRRIRLTWPLLTVGTALAISLLWGTLLLATDHSRNQGMAQASAAYAMADRSRTDGLSANGLHPIIWEVPPAAARKQLLAAISVESRFSDDLTAIAFPLSVRCDAARVAAATEQVKAAELNLIQESYAGTLSHTARSTYLDAINARGSADYTLRQGLGLTARIPLVNWWPSYC